MKLYHFPPSPNSRRVLATAFHLGIELDLVSVDLSKGEQMKPRYLKLNPNHMIPTLVDGDFVLWESTAIMQYLADKHAGNQLYPDEIKQRANVNRWLAWNIAHWGTACQIFIFERLVKKMINIGEEDPVEIAKGEERFRRFGKVLDHCLKKNRWVTGDKLTLADFAIGSPMDLASVAEYPLSEFKSIKRWYGEIEKLDAWKKSKPSNFN